MGLGIALIFGGKSVEHEISVISGIQAYNNIDKQKYNVVPVYMTKDNKFYIGKDIANIGAYKDIKALLAKSEQVILEAEEEGDFALVSVYKKPGFFSKTTYIAIDLVLPVVHGTNVEDGTLQGYLKTIGVPFVGCDVTAAAVSMDKYIQKLIVKQAGVPVIDAKTYTLHHYEHMDRLIANAEKRIGYPAIVKPVNLGSSVGIGVAKNRDELIERVDEAFKYATKIIVEHAITNLREINCSVLGDENEARASECEEPLHTDEILSYADKYVSNAKNSKSSGMASVARKIPAEIAPQDRLTIQKLAVRAFQALGCSGVARIDFMIDSDTSNLYFNEINTIPGSLSFYLWEASGIKYSELLDEMINIAQKNNRQKENVSYTFDTNVLSQAKIDGVKK